MMDEETKKGIWNLIMRKVPESIMFIVLIYIMAVFGLGWIYHILTENDKLDAEYIQNITYAVIGIVVVLTIFSIGLCIYIFIKQRKTKQTKNLSEASEQSGDLPEGKIDAFIVEQDAEARDEKYKKINKNVKKTYWVLGVSLNSLSSQESMLKKMANNNIRIRLCMMDPDIVVEDLCLNSLDNDACNLKEVMEKIKNDQIKINDLKEEFENLKNCKDMLEIYHILINVIHFKEYYDTDTDYKNTIKISCQNLKEIRSNIVRKHDQYTFELGIADSFMPMSLTIVDAEEEYGRMVVEFHLPFTQYRVLFEINKKDNDDLFGVFLKFYRIVWERANKSE